MRFGLITLLAAFGCGGANTNTTESTDSDVQTFNEIREEQEGACADVPEYDFDGMDCDGLTDAFNAIVDAASECEEKSDCTLVHPQCETWNEVFCYYPVNVCLDQTVIAAINANAGNCISGTEEGCQCTGAPKVDCVNGRCLFVYDF